MPFEVAIPAIDSALRTLLVAEPSLTALIATKPSARGGGPAIYADGEVPTGQTFPYLTIGAWTQNKFHRFSPSGSPGEGSGWGWNCTGVVKVVGQLVGGRTETTFQQILTEVFGALPEGERLNVEGYSSAWVHEWSLQPAIKTTLAGIVTIEVPAILRVYVCD